MALVAYDNSSSSESEEEETNSKVTIITSTKLLKTPSTTSVGNVSELGALANLFTTLPTPKVSDSSPVEEQEDEFLQKKEQPVETPKKVVKIGVASLADFDSDEEEVEPTRKKAKLNSQASGLFALLPEPKVVPRPTTSFVPYVLQKKNTKPPAKPATVHSASQKKTPAKTLETVNDELEDEEDDVDNAEEAHITNSLVNGETCMEAYGWNRATPKPEYSSSSKVTPPVETSQNWSVPMAEDSKFANRQSLFVQAAPSVNPPYYGMDNQAFQELVGSRRRVKETIEVIDIHEDEIRPDRAEWLRSLTDPNFEPQSATAEPVNNTCRAKNHITSLAQKAVANDQQLQQRWAESRHNRRQTQAKYGF